MRWVGKIQMPQVGIIGRPLTQVALAAECAALGQAVARAWGGGSRRRA
jgi:hypothetical protein